MDVMTPAQRSRTMRAIKSKNTKIELMLGKAMWARGIRYRKNNKTVFGTPDFTIKKYKIAIFCDSEFFHGRNWETKKHRIKTNVEFWHNKIERNIKRDQLVNKTLAEDGWIVLRFWGSEIKKTLEGCLEKIDNAIKERQVVQYSKIRRKLRLDKKHIQGDDGLSYLTHYLQSKNDNPTPDFEVEAKTYLESQSLAAEPLFQYGWPIQYDVPFPPPSHPDFTFIDLFAGIGGFRIAFQHLNGKCVFASEWNPVARSIYETNFGEIPFGDIMEIAASQVPDHDLLLAGFPFQPFASKTETAGNLFFEIARVLDEKKPKAFLLETTKQLIAYNNGQTFDIAKTTLEALGYRIQTKVLNAIAFVPQYKERLFMVGVKQNNPDATMPFQFPELPGTIPPIKNIFESVVSRKYTLSNQVWEDLQHAVLHHANKGTTKGKAVDFKKRQDIIWLNSYKDETEILIAQPGKNPRRLTPREYARLYGFPDELLIPVPDAKAYRQLGNAAVVPLATHLGRAIVEALRRVSDD